MVAPLGAKPVQVLTQSAPACSLSWQAATFSLVGQVGVFENYFDLDAARHGPHPDCLDIVAHGIQVAGAQLADIDDHVQLAGAVVDRFLGLEYFDGGGAAAVRKADDRADQDIRAGEQT